MKPKRRKLTLRKILQARLALQTLLDSEIPEQTVQYGGTRRSPRAMVEALLWDVLVPMERLFDERE